MWRLRVIIESEAILDIGEINSNDVLIKVFKIVDNNNLDIDKRFRHLDFFLLKEENDIYSAYTFLYETLNEFLDRFSTVSYGKTFIREVISITKDKVNYGEVFELALPQFSIGRELSSINLNDLKFNKDIEDNQKRWERLFRLGLNSNSPEEKYISYYSLLEEMAKFYSKEKILNECPKCKKKTDTGRIATNKYIKNLLIAYNVDKKLEGKASLIRNKIAHGGGTKSKQFYADLMHLNSYFEEICILELEKKLEIDILNRLNVHISDIPIVTHQGVYAKDGLVDLISSNIKIPARHVHLKSETISIENQTTRIGFPLDDKSRPIISPFAFPDLILEEAGSLLFQKILLKT